MSESKTPMTYEATIHDSWHGDYVPSEFARQLETENAEISGKKGAK